MEKRVVDQTWVHSAKDRTDPHNRWFSPCRDLVLHALELSNA
jgi:hypothetical protein